MYPTTKILSDKGYLDFSIKTARKYPQIKSTEKLREQFIKDATDEGDSREFRTFRKRLFY
jgi:hypothetical protein